MSTLALLFSSGLGIGYIPWASGTFGTLWGLLLFYLCRDLDPLLFLLGVVALFFLSVLSTFYAERKLKSSDSSIIVIDEVVGYLVACIGFTYNFWIAALAFGLFRLFDILKPFPISTIDRRCKNAWGVILDDVLAGIFANVALRILLIFWGWAK